MTEREQILQLQIEVDALQKLLHKAHLALDLSRHPPMQPEFVESVRRQIRNKLKEIYGAQHERQG